MNRIVLAVDLSPTSAVTFEALKFLQHLVPGGTGEITALYLYDDDSDQQLAQQKLQEFCFSHHFRGEAVVHPVGNDGPASTLSEFVEREGVQLLIIATHSRHGIGRMFLGSVAEELLKAPPCPILVAPSSFVMRESLIAKVVVATDLLSDESALYDFSSRLYRAIGSNSIAMTLLYLVYDVTRASFHLLSSEQERGDIFTEIEAEATNALNNVISTWFSDAPVHTALVRVEGDLPEEINLYTRNHGTNLLVMATKDYGEELGRIPPKVARDIVCPLLVLPG